MHFKFTPSQCVLLIVAGVALVAFWISRISEDRIRWDAADNLTMTLNLERYGVVSMRNEAPFGPTMYREPLPVFVGQFAIRAVDRLLGPADRDEYFRGERARLLKFQHLAWLALLSAAVFALALESGLSFGLSLLCVLLTNSLLLHDQINYFMLDSLYTESAASALLCLGSLFLLVGARRAGAARMAAAGLCFGLLMLVKAAYLYLTLGMLVAIPVTAMWLRQPMKSALRQAAAFSVTALLVALPWMLRNYHEFGYLGVCLRGGEALYDRAVLDEMTADEYIGAYYFYAPYPLNGALRRVFGYVNSDLQSGGRLQRLNESSVADFYERDYLATLSGRPQDAVTYMRRSGAERVQLTQQLATAGDPHPVVSADRILLARAISFILQHPLRHLALFPLNLWAGALLCFPAFTLILVQAVRGRRYDVVVMSLPAYGSLLFFAMFAHLEYRYAIPTYPIVLCGLVALACELYRKRVGRRAGLDQTALEVEPTA